MSLLRGFLKRQREFPKRQLWAKAVRWSGGVLRVGVSASAVSTLNAQPSHRRVGGLQTTYAWASSQPSYLKPQQVSSATGRDHPLTLAIPRIT